jgi:putative ABC transport system ATP-binding protein
MKIHVSKIQTPFFKVSEFEISSGEKVLIKGPSGTGKTTFLHLLAGLYRPTNGEVLWNETSLYNLTDSQLSHLRKLHSSLIFQNLNLLSYLTALENIELGGVEKSTAQDLLAQVGLQDKGTLTVQQMSLGEQQRVAVARVLGQSSSLLLADEPSSSLDDKNSEQVMNLLLKPKKTQTLIMVSHDHRIEKFFDRIVSVEGIFG